MPNTRPAQDPALLRALKNGEDRGGEPRTWREVATLRGISHQHCRRLAVGRPSRAPAPVDIDPREIIPDLKALMSDEDVADWNQTHHCLCGCGATTSQAITGVGSVPYGAYYLFRPGHQKRMPWMEGRQFTLTPMHQQRRTRSLLVYNDSVPTAVIGGMIGDWCQTHDSNLRQFAAACGMSERHVREIAGGTRVQVRKSTAARILWTLGEPMRPEIAQAYIDWATETGAKVPSMKWLTQQRRTRGGQHDEDEPDDENPLP